ncbi:unnamed protein product, partial [Ectocarpus fasciculatus]
SFFSTHTLGCSHHVRPACRLRGWLFFFPVGAESGNEENPTQSSSTNWSSQPQLVCSPLDSALLVVRPTMMSLQLIRYYASSSGNLSTAAATVQYCPPPCYLSLFKTQRRRRATSERA